MKNNFMYLVFLMASLFSTSLFSQTGSLCTVELVDRGFVVQTFRARDNGQGLCRDALRECNLEKRRQGLNLATCERRQGPVVTPGPVPGPSPIPNPNPPYQFPVVKTGDIVYPKSWEHDRGATVIATYLHTDEVMVRSNSSGNTFYFKTYQLAFGYGCVAQACVNDRVFPLSWEHDRGAEVFAIDFQDQKLLVKSLSSGKVFQFQFDDVGLDHGCVMHACVGATVYPRGWGHALGARVLAVNPLNRRVVVKSNSSGKVFTFDIFQL